MPFIAVKKIPKKIEKEKSIWAFISFRGFSPRFAGSMDFSPEGGGRDITAEGRKVAFLVAAGKQRESNRGWEDDIVPKVSLPSTLFHLQYFCPLPVVHSNDEFLKGLIHS